MLIKKKIKKRNPYAQDLKLPKYKQRIVRSKKAYLLQEHADCIPLMKSIKKSIDQNNIMNPGKIFDLN